MHMPLCWLVRQPPPGWRSSGDWGLESAQGVLACQLPKQRGAWSYLLTLSASLYMYIYVWVDISTICSSTSFYTIDYYSLCQCTRRYVGSKARFLLLLLCRAIVVWATVFLVFSICRFFLVLDDVGGGIVWVCQGGVGDARLSVGLAGLLKHVVEEVRVNFLEFVEHFVAVLGLAERARHGLN